MAQIAGSYGIQYVIICKNDNDEDVDISSFTTTEFDWKDPDGTIFTKTAVFLTNGEDAKLSYTLIPGDIPASSPGRWRYRAHIQKSGSNLYSEWLVEHFDAPT